MIEYIPNLTEFRYLLCHASLRCLQFFVIEKEFIRDVYFDSEQRKHFLSLFSRIGGDLLKDAQNLKEIAEYSVESEHRSKLNPHAANEILGLGNSNPRSTASTAYRILRAQNVLQRAVLQLTSHDGSRLENSILSRIGDSIEQQRDEVRALRPLARMLSVYEHVQPFIQIAPDAVAFALDAATASSFDYLASYLSCILQPSPTEGHDVIVWYGTNRASSSPGIFIEGRSTDTSYGRCRVFVPKNRIKGSLGRHFFGRMLLGDNRVFVNKIEPLDERAFWLELKSCIMTDDEAEQQVLVFLHGYRTSFMDAARRTAQLKVDLEHAGPAVFFSWPSFGNLADYPGDEAAIDGSEIPIQNFLTELAKHSGASAVHIIAHSMGNRALTRALHAITLATHSGSSVRFGQVFFAAPDVDSDYFRSVSGAYASISTRSTLYVTDDDKAIMASAGIHRYPRAGLMPPITIVPSVDTIDASQVNIGLLGHDYALTTRTLLSDINRLLQDNSEPDIRFGLEPMYEKGIKYWKFVP